MYARSAGRPEISGDQFVADSKQNRGDSIEITQGDPPLAADPDDVHAIGDYCDHLRALVSQRRSLRHSDCELDLRIKNTTERILSHQLADGSFGDSRRPFTPIEPTAHALIALAEAGHDPQDEAIRDAIAFLASQVRVRDGSVRSAGDAADPGWPGGPDITPALRHRLPYAKGIRRTHPAALALLALSAWNGASKEVRGIRKFLLRSSTPQGWGQFAEAPPSPASTALVLYALIASGEDPGRFTEPAAFLRLSQRSGGWWPAETEMWSVRNEAGIHLSLTSIDTAAYAVLALIRIGRPAAFVTAARALRYLKAEHRFAEEHRKFVVDQAPLPTPSPPGNVADMIAVTLAKAKEPWPTRLGRIFARWSLGSTRGTVAGI
ncbi:hypothetical protein GCM10029992_34890 [Glycomyces albus]